MYLYTCTYKLVALSHDRIFVHAVATQVEILSYHEVELSSKLPDNHAVDGHPPIGTGLQLQCCSKQHLVKPREEMHQRRRYKHPHNCVWHGVE